MNEYICLRCKKTSGSAASLDNLIDPRCPNCGSYLLRDAKVKKIKLGDLKVSTIQTILKNGMSSRIVSFARNSVV